MKRSRFRSILATALMMATCLGILIGPSTAGATASKQTGQPPAGIDPTHAMVRGILVARPVDSTGNIGPIVCGDRDATAAVRTVMVNRGLVICTEDGRLVLVQVNLATKITNRNWELIGVRALVRGDHINAWGRLQAGGAILNPTFVVQDTSRPEVSLQFVQGTLVPKPVPNGGSNPPTICRDRDVTAQAHTLAVNRGLVICTNEGKLVLLQLSAGTRITGIDRVAATVAQLTDGDHILAWGKLQDGESLLSPTHRVRDINIRTRGTNSQDFITRHDDTLTLDVLRSDAGSTIEGIIHARRGGRTQVYLCDGRAGTWDDLRAGMTIDISGSTFNNRTTTYVDTDVIHVVSCR